MITVDIRRNKKTCRIMADISKMTHNGAFKAYVPQNYKRAYVYLLVKITWGRQARFF